jgi:hypothetical protein
VNRADDDAHTLTVAAAHAQPATEWLGGFWAIEPDLTLHVAVPADEPVALTITL